MHQNVTPEGLEIQNTAGVPYLQGIPDSIRALQNVIEYAHAVRRGALPTPALTRAGHGGDKLDIKALLAEAGITLPKEVTAATAHGAALAAEEIGFPVALKIISPDATHKTEVGGVALNLQTPNQVQRRAEAMLAQMGRHHAKARIDGFLLQEMVAGVEMIVGARMDESFGPVIVAGFGGISAELLHDTAIRLTPIDEATARDMLGSLRAARLLDEFRGRPVCDVDALVNAIQALSLLYLEHSNWISEIEINPLVVLENGKGVRAVDVRVVYTP
jgi:acyl-CoA synthetase (NDP forming)